jgi:hypothetical protein
MMIISYYPQVVTINLSLFGRQILDPNLLLIYRKNVRKKVKMTVTHLRKKLEIRRRR